METIFNRKIIFKRKQKINFDNSLYKTTEKQIFEELLDYFFIFQNSEKIKNILILNSKNDFLEKQLNEYLSKNKNNSEKINFHYFEFLENDEENINNISELKKNNLIVGINSFHNVNYLEKYIVSVKNNLEDGGIFCGNFFGINNLLELKTIIINNDSIFSKNIYPRFNPTISPESISQILQKFNFQNIVIFPEKINFEFNSFSNAMNFLQNINERNYLITAQKTPPNKKIFMENMPKKINLDFEIIKFYCLVGKI
jgi:hypothetical protein